MGLRSAETVPPFFSIEDPVALDGTSCAPPDALGPCNRVKGTVHVVRMEDVVACNGARVPGTDDAQRDFSVKFVFVTSQPDDIDPEDRRIADEVRSSYAAYWHVATGRRSTMAIDREATCGDGMLQPGEDCDDGVENDWDRPDACRPDCRRSRCGDGSQDTGEACDAANNFGCCEGCRLSFSGYSCPVRWIGRRGSCGKRDDGRLHAKMKRAARAIQRMAPRPTNAERMTPRRYATVHRALMRLQRLADQAETQQGRRQWPTPECVAQLRALLAYVMSPAGGLPTAMLPTK
jgi:hypothetical protein